MSLLREVTRRLVAAGVREAGAGAVTIDLDATIIDSGKRACLSTYRAASGSVPGERGYQPLIAFCPELGMVPWLEMRDGNVPAKLDNRRGLKEALLQLPDEVGHVVLRSDAAGYQEEVIRACNDPAFRREETRRPGTLGLICGAVRSEPLMAEVMDSFEVVAAAHARCGHGEEVHAMLKSDLVGGMMPSGRFGANAAWLAALAMNVLALLRRAACGQE